MNQADRDAQKWMEMQSRNQYRNLIQAKESGDLHHINAFGEVVIEKSSVEGSTVKE